METLGVESVFLANFDVPQIRVLVQKTVYEGPTVGADSQRQRGRVLGHIVPRHQNLGGSSSRLVVEESPDLDGGDQFGRDELDVLAYNIKAVPGRLAFERQQGCAVLVVLTSRDPAQVFQIGGDQGMAPDG